jgi:hypothetical protein
VYGGEDSPASLSGLAGAEHLQGGWDPATTHGRPLSWDSMAHAPANVPVPVRRFVPPLTFEPLLPAPWHAGKAWQV